MDIDDAMIIGDAKRVKCKVREELKWRFTQLSKPILTGAIQLPSVSLIHLSRRTTFSVRHIDALNRYSPSLQNVEIV